MSSELKLYNYFRSSASYRVRIALNIKQLPYETITVHLVNHGGEQQQANYLKLNPQGLVPSLEENAKVLTQSLAIIEYLDEKYPHPPLLPKDYFDRAKIRSLALSVACDIHPLNNLRTLNYLRQEFKASDQSIKNWYHHWLILGFEAFERSLSSIPREKYCFGNRPTLADVCLIPQVYNAHRFELSMDNYPLINEIYQHCMSLEPFHKAAPEL